ncbi:unnamed protein product [Protopolystoma xenopodis]|uniref:Uncharacterized protein n=1 Tax=Protopolystoma xenopodis TaxID=117903 RepID=A0A448XIV5_9PLAT|nr:unnamed protein product [Protopolystoma xenopodis]
MLQEFDYFLLVHGLNTRKQTGSSAGLTLFFNWEVVELATCERFPCGWFILTEDADASANGFGSGFVVAGYHYDPDTGLAALLDAVEDLCARRVQHADYTDESQIVLVEEAKGVNKCKIGEKIGE